jgi:hypothetical protein
MALKTKKEQRPDHFVGALDGAVIATAEAPYTRSAQRLVRARGENRNFNKEDNHASERHHDQGPGLLYAGY